MSVLKDNTIGSGLYCPVDLICPVSLTYAGGLKDVPALSPSVGH